MKYEVFIADTERPDIARQNAVFFETETQDELLQKIAEHYRPNHPPIPFEIAIIFHKPGKAESIAVMQWRSTGLHTFSDEGIASPKPVLAV